jgi:hypothetical protein
MERTAIKHRNLIIRRHVVAIHNGADTEFRDRNCARKTDPVFICLLFFAL